MFVAIIGAIHYLLKIYVFIAGHLYFRQLRITGRRNIPTSGPVILAINHQNALLDALLISAFCRRSIFFITRGDIFKSGFLNRLLRGLKMIPVYRVKDGYMDLKRNDETFEELKNLLLQGRMVGIFPEGSHSIQYKVRPLKRGIARLAFLAENAAGFKADLKIVPVGMQYESHFGPGGRTLISFGNPISPAVYREEYEVDQNRAENHLLSVLSAAMKALVLDINGDYDKVYAQFKDKRVTKHNLSEQLRADQALVSAINDQRSFTQADDTTTTFHRLVSNTRRAIWRVLVFLPKSLVDALIRAFTHDPNYYGSMRFIYTIFVYPAFFLLSVLVFWQLFR